MNAASATSKGTILVVDDNRLVLATLSDGLTRAGYHVYDADNGDDAILIARAHRPQLALLDIRMEGKSGFDVAHYLRHQCGMPFMFLSAFSDEQTIAQVKALGAVAYLVKPLDIKQIVPAVEAAFAHIETQPAAPAAEANKAPRAAPVGANANDTSAAMAVGVLMHRYSLGRDEAAARLLRLAREAGITMHAQAELLLAAVEQLAGPARH
ncbi:MAG TPA: response regulator [Caldimonas sp.]|nr:response regulator [Caldimonas sp.]